jgi:hypothetical protein
MKPAETQNHRTFPLISHAKRRRKKNGEQHYDDGEDNRFRDSEGKKGCRDTEKEKGDGERSWLVHDNFP